MKNKINISEFLQNLLASYKDSRTKKNIEEFFGKIFTNKSIQLWKISKNSKEYQRFHNLIKGKLVNTLDVKTLNKNLLINSISCLKCQYRVVVIHDGSEIRKPENQELENIGFVQSLDGTWVKRYKTLNRILIDNRTENIKLNDYRQSCLK